MSCSACYLRRLACMTYAAEYRSRSRAAMSRFCSGVSLLRLMMGAVRLRAPRWISAIYLIPDRADRIFTMLRSIPLRASVRRSSELSIKARTQ